MPRAASPDHSSLPPAPWLERLFGVAAGVFVGLCILKLGTPCVLDQLVTPPQSSEEWRIAIWPPRFGYFPLILLCLGSLFFVRLKPRPSAWMVAPPLVWLAWQLIAATQSSAPKLTALTLPHFAGCVASYFVGLLALGRLRDWRWFAAPVLISFLWMLRVGIGQHFGGLAETKAFVLTYYGADQLPPDLAKRISGGRVFSTLFYPNAFAGALLLLLPFVLGAVWEFSRRLQLPSRILITGIVGIAALGCLVWSGSKAGWLLMLLITALAGWRVPVPTQWKTAVLILLVAGGLAGFAIRYAAFFKRGATSVVARFDYWSCASRLFLQHPVLGTGPGTFSTNYAKIKRPEAEMARLVHNDYLQQASDSGAIGFLAYLAWIAAVTRVGLGFVRKSCLIEWVLALGLIGWFLQGLVEFGLYIPGLAWPGFMLAGMLAGWRVNAVDKLRISR